MTLFKNAAHYNSSPSYISELCEAITGKHGLSLSQIAEQIGVPPGALISAARGKSKTSYPVQHTLQALLDADSTQPVKENS